VLALVPAPQLWFEMERPSQDKAGKSQTSGCHGRNNYDRLHNVLNLADIHQRFATPLAASASLTTQFPRQTFV
jgi:hypothetical protein